MDIDNQPTFNDQLTNSTEPIPIYSEPAQLQSAQIEQQKPHRKYRGLVIIGSSIVSVILLAGGFYLFFSYRATDESGRTIPDLQMESASLDAPISEQAETEASTFYNTGFSAVYFDAADNTAKLQAQKTDLEDTIEELSAQEAEKNIITTGSIWLFVAALLALASGITVYLRL